MRRPNERLRSENARAAWEQAQQGRAAGDVLRARCELVTPMYGGGVATGEVDRALPIRPSALRGQLRFWWRLLNGQDQDSRALFTAESALWGGITGQGPRASLVTLQVIAKPVGEERLSPKSRIREFPAYALILEPGADPSLLSATYSFELVLRFDPKVTATQHDEVIQALRWWASFGGVGARTRRGLGAVKVRAHQAELTPVGIEEVAALGGWLALRKPQADAMSAWKSAIEPLRLFRQGENLGRNPGKQRSRPGRSRWPEPDAIRRVTKRHASTHAPEHPVEGFYPRAAFGLPVIFHFKDRGDPQDATLEPTGDGDRMASPLILRPYLDGTRYRPAALLLPGWEELISVPVRFGGGAARPAWPTDAAERARLAAQIQPMQGRGTDALSAFMDYFAQETR